MEQAILAMQELQRGWAIPRHAGSRPGNGRGGEGSSTDTGVVIGRRILSLRLGADTGCRDVITTYHSGCNKHYVRWQVYESVATPQGLLILSHNITTHTHSSTSLIVSL